MASAALLLRFQFMSSLARFFGIQPQKTLSTKKITLFSLLGISLMPHLLPEVHIFLRFVPILIRRKAGGPTCSSHRAWRITITLWSTKSNCYLSMATLDLLDRRLHIYNAIRLIGAFRASEPWRQPSPRSAPPLGAWATPLSSWLSSSAPATSYLGPSLHKTSLRAIQSSSLPFRPLHAADRLLLPKLKSPHKLFHFSAHTLQTSFTRPISSLYTDPGHV
jgi:hypothetical protein